MAVAHQLSYPFRDFHYWDENECLEYYGLLSLHEVFEIVGSQLTETDIEVLSFILNETCTVQHPLDPAGWTVEPSEDDPNDIGVRPSPQLLNLWRRLNASTSPQPLFASHKPKSGLELLLELENRGYISEGNLEPLLQLLRVLTRHDLLPFVSHKRRRTVSPERFQHWHGAEHRELMFASGLPQTCRAAEMPLSSFTQQGRSGLYSPVPVAPAQNRRRKRGNGWSRKPKKIPKPSQPPPPPPPAPKSLSCVTHSDRIFGDRSRLRNSSKQSLCAYTGFHMLAHCFGPCRRAEGQIFVAAVDSRWFLSELLNIEEDLSRALAQDNVRLRVRAEYLEHESALRNGVASDKRQPLERQFELFSQANSVLRARNLGSIVFDIKFTELDNLQAFWVDYLSGALLEALKGVFITDSLRSAAGSEGVRLLISVDQDDYEEGCHLLRGKKGPHAEPGQGHTSAGLCRGTEQTH